MTKPKFETLYCEVCGVEVGKKSGVGAVVGLRCPDPYCAFVPPADPVQTLRNDMIAALVLAGRSVPLVALQAGVSRQRVYQVMDGWRKGQ